MSNTSVGTWLSFFKDAGIPSGLGATYAVIFCDHRIQKEFLGDLSRDILVEMGIKAMGDVIAILKHGKHLAKEMTRENTSKLLTKRDISPAKPKLASIVTTSAVAGEVESMDTDEHDKSVFSRLGEDEKKQKESAVFKRLGEPVKTVETSKNQTHESKERSIRKVLSESQTTKSEVSKKKVAVKRKHVLDRLGPESENTSLSNSLRSDHTNDDQRKSVLKRLGSSPESEKRRINRSDSSSDDDDDEKAPKVIRLVPVRRVNNPSKSLMKSVKPSKSRNTQSSVLRRLGKSSINVEKQRKKSPIIKRTFGSATTGRVLAMDSEAKKSTVHKTNKLMERQSKSKSAIVKKKALAMDSVDDVSPQNRLQLRKNMARKSSSNMAGALARKALTDGAFHLRSSVIGIKRQKSASARVLTGPQSRSVFDRLGS